MLKIPFKIKLSESYASKLLVILLLLPIFCLSASAQGSSEVSYQRGATYLEDVLPPSPESASRVKYSDFPFAHSTGAAEYRVPLYEMKGRTLRIPLSLVYCSNGIRVDEIAGVAGLGWSLEAGGCITREVVYMPDEFTDGQFSYIWPEGTLKEELLAGTQSSDARSFLSKIVMERLDTFSDRYSYSVMGLSGKFIITPSGDIVQLQGDGVRISYSDAPGGERTFTITGPDGSVYTLADRETGTRKGQYRMPTPMTGQDVDWDATTAWYLSGVTSRDGSESATFTYADGGLWDRSTASVTKVLTMTPSANTQGFEDDLGGTSNFVRSNHRTRVLSSITLSGFTATFGYGAVSSRSRHSVNSGQDAPNYPRRLTSVTVTSPSGERLLKALTQTAEHSHDGRIILEGVDLYGSSDSHPEDRWRFSYRTASHSISRYSQDWFGYFNGENGDWIIPNRPIGTYVPASRSDLCPYRLNNLYGYSLSLAYGAPDEGESSYMMLTEADHDGARTTWEYEGASSGTTMTVHGETVDVKVGVRVKCIRIYNGNSLVRARTFTYEQPCTSAPVVPLEEYYLRTSARIVERGGLTTPRTGTRWTFTLHETPVTDGLNIGSARVWYGRVTEEVSAPSSTPVSSGVIFPEPLEPGYRTVYTFDTAPSQNPWYNTRARFPSEWVSTYAGAATGVEPFSGVQSQYRYDGAVESPRLILRETYRKNPLTGQNELVEKESTDYAAFGSSTVMTGYASVRVMERLLYGDLRQSDMQHYPLFSMARLGSSPSRVTRVGYHPSGNDTTITLYTVTRPVIDKPARNMAVSVSSPDATRTLTLDYPDTWTGADAPSYAGELTLSHSLSEPLRRTLVTTSISSGIDFPGGEVIFPRLSLPHRPFIPIGGGGDTVRVVTEYGHFGGSLMKSARIEYMNGEESWREEIRSRDCLGNPSEIKVKGRPLTALLWSYSGLYPVALVEGISSFQDVVAAFGGQAQVDALTRSEELTGQQKTKLENLRSHYRTAGCLVTTMTHIPGRGTERKRTPQEIATSYSYDEAGRLHSISNTLGQMTDEYEYSLLNTGDNLLSATHHRYRSPAFQDGTTSAGASSSSDSSSPLKATSVTWWNALGLRTHDIEEDASPAQWGVAHTMSSSSSSSISYSPSPSPTPDLVRAYGSDYMLHDDVRTYLPYPAAAAAGNGRMSAEAARQGAVSYHGSQEAYYGKTYEESSREEVLSETLPGYASHPDRSWTDVVTSFPILLWKNNAVQVIGTYSPGGLVARVEEDADGRQSVVVSDHHGRVLATGKGSLSSLQQGGWMSSTRYVYDGFDRLAAVAGADIALTDTLSMWRYGYDRLGRLASGGIPGSVREYYGYDSEDRVVSIRRGEELTEIEYDSFGRETARYLTAGGFAERVKTVGMEYDSYSAGAVSLLGGGGYASGPSKGLLTLSSVAATDGRGGFGGMVTTAYAYDALGRPERTVTLYPDGYRSTTVTTYDFTGNPLSVVTTGIRAGGGGS